VGGHFCIGDDAFVINVVVAYGCCTLTLRSCTLVRVCDGRWNGMHSGAPVIFHYRPRPELTRHSLFDGAWHLLYQAPHGGGERNLPWLTVTNIVRLQTCYALR